MKQDELPFGDWVLIGILIGTVLLAGGCISTTIKNANGGTVNVTVTKTITSDASIPASVIP